MEVMPLIWYAAAQPVRVCTGDIINEETHQFTLYYIPERNVLYFHYNA